MSANPDSLQYTADHEWLDSDGRVGVTATAAERLGDVVYLAMSVPVGDHVGVGDVLGEIESVKSVAEIFSPVAGTLVAVNDAAVDDPSLVNADPYGAWLVQIDVESTGELLTAAQYDEVAAS